MEEELDNSVYEHLGITEDVLAEIKKTVKDLKTKNDGVKVILPLAVKGRKNFGEKELYVGYFCQPSFKNFSKYLVGSTQNQAGAMRQLARDCFLGGDKELIDDDSLFLFGLMGQLAQIIEMRSGALVNL